MAGINKAIIVGRLGKDPEIRHMQSGTQCANFSVATSENWTDKNTGAKKEKTEWHNIVAWGKLAEICAQYLFKGKQVYIEGKIQTDEWHDNEGNKRYTTKIIASTMQMLGSVNDGKANQSGAEPEPDYNYQEPASSAYNGGEGQTAYQRKSEPEKQPPPPHPDVKTEYPDEQTEDDDDDLPF
jgi:single-strand DNA-binding protein